MSREDLDLEQLDQLAREFWQDDLAKFFPKQKEPTYTEYKMFQAGFQKALELQEVDKDVKMFLNEHDENVRLHFENVDLKEQNAQLIDALSKVQALTFSFVMNKDNAADILLIVKPIRDVIKQTLERNKL